MKREYVVLDSLASMTADALFAPKPELRAAEPADREQRSICSIGRWFKAATRQATSPAGPRTARLTLDDDWVGGWYARTRLLQAATLANVPARAEATSTEAADGETRISADVVSQVKDYS
jgi:hypothetical protein